MRNGVKGYGDSWILDCCGFFSPPTGKNCSIDWATYITDERNLLLLVKIDSGQFYLVNFNTGKSGCLEVRREHAGVRTVTIGPPHTCHS